MKYLVIATHKEVASIDNYRPFINDFTIVAESHNNELAKKIMEYFNKNDKHNHCEVHPVMEDEDIINFLNK